MSAEWKTAADLAAEMGKSLRWVRERMASGDIPTVKVGSTRFFTPACRDELNRRALAKADADEGWSQVTRGSGAA